LSTALESEPEKIFQRPFFCSAEEIEFFSQHF
jgi:hypothetical protein